LAVAPPWQRGVVETAAAVREQAVTPSEVLESVLGRIEEVEPGIRAFVHVDRAAAERQAEELTREAAAGSFRGPLHGVPIAIKDIFDVAGLPTKRGSALFENAAPAAADAAVVARLRSAGAILVGKTATHELACGVYTASSRNPWDLSRCCGGSSGGSGAAVAAGAAMAATGSDTGGSIRIPAAVCGIVGVKPTYDLLSRDGVAALAWSLDHVGPLARSFEDAALVLQTMTDPTRLADGGEGAPVWPIPTVDLAATVVGVPEGGILARVDPEVQAAFEDACALLATAGARIVPVSLPELEETLSIEFAIVMAEAASYYDRELRRDSALISEGIRGLFQSGAALPAGSYLLAQRLRAGICRAVDRAFAEHGLDTLCTPTVPLPAYGPDDTTVVIGGEEESIADATVRTTAPFNLTGSPVVSVPMALTEERLPVAVQFAGRAYEEGRLLAIAREYERLRDSRELDEHHPIHRLTWR
jgi:aspartyl-tRNA(Asn)/glutamyl-tRNA(Gln) amidotransferase subunit A